MEIVKVSCFPNEGTPQVIAGDPVTGDLVRVTDGDRVQYYRYTEIPPYTPAPRVLTKTSFQDYCIGQLGGSTTGMARFTEIMDATRDSTSGAVRFAYARYEAAQTFEKSNTAALTTIMAADDTTGHLTADERTAILNNWPVA